MKEMQFNDERELRDKYVERFDVLERVKNLLLIPNSGVMTINQVANYYSNESKSVTPDAIRKLYSLHKDEFDSDGVYIKSYKDFLIGNEFTLENLKGKVILTHQSGMLLEIPNRGIRVFTKRAILRVGMLLRDSEIAKEVRTQLLNIEEKVSNEVKIQDITEEQSLMLAVGMAFASGDLNAFATASTNLVAFKNRYIYKLEENNEKLETDNIALAKGILEWSDRSRLNSGLRMLKRFTDLSYAELWNELYRNLQYKYGICLKQRGNSPYIQHVKKNEWDKVIKVFGAMCEAYGKSPTEMFRQTEISV